MFLRGSNEGRADGQQNPDGELTLGSYQTDYSDSHVHNISGFGTAQLYNTGFQWGTNIQAGSRIPTATGGNETRSRKVTVNYFLRTNERPHVNRRSGRYRPWSSGRRSESASHGSQSRRASLAAQDITQEQRGHMSP